MSELMEIIKGGSWVAFSAFGAYLAYKVSMTSIVCFSFVKTTTKLLDAYNKRSPHGKEMTRLIEAAGLLEPLSPEEWDQLIRRVRNT